MNVRWVIALGVLTLVTAVSAVAGPPTSLANEKAKEEALWKERVDEEKGADVNPYSWDTGYEHRVPPALQRPERVQRRMVARALYATRQHDLSELADRHRLTPKVGRASESAGSLPPFQMEIMKEERLPRLCLRLKFRQLREDGACPFGRAPAIDCHSPACVVERARRAPRGGCATPQRTWWAKGSSDVTHAPLSSALVVPPW